MSVKVLLYLGPVLLCSTIIHFKSIVLSTFYSEVLISLNGQIAVGCDALRCMELLVCLVSFILIIRGGKDRYQKGIGQVLGLSNDILSHHFFPPRFSTSLHCHLDLPVES